MHTEAQPYFSPSSHAWRICSPGGLRLKQRVAAVRQNFIDLHLYPAFHSANGDQPIAALADTDLFTVGLT